MKIEVDIKGVEGNEEVTKAIVEKIQNHPQLEGLDKVIDEVVHDYIVQRVLNKLEYTISGSEVRDTYKEICREKVNEFCNNAFEKDKETLEQEVTKIIDLIQNQMVDIFVNSMFNQFVVKMQQHEWDTRWGVIEQIKNDIRNRNL